VFIAAGSVLVGGIGGRADSIAIGRA
jgi:hypothetical protein